MINNPNFKIRPNAHKCWRGGSNYKMIIGWGSFLCSLCKDPHKSIDLYLDEKTIKEIKEKEEA
jgi:hypothetical protein